MKNYADFVFPYKGGQDICKAFSNNNLSKLTDDYSLVLDEKIGEGAFGKIYNCVKTKSNEIFACKLESIKNNPCPQLVNESKILSLMKGKTGFPTSYSFLKTKTDYALIMSKLGPNLEFILSNIKNNKFSLKSSLIIFQQVLTRIKELHDVGYIHRDLKPENFVIGPESNPKTIYLIDFGLSHKFSIDKSKDNFSFSKNKKKQIEGTIRYISINTHKGLEQGRRDDVEALLYIIVYFILGELPWMNIKAKGTNDKYEKICSVKQRTVPNTLCEVLPDEFKQIFKHVLKLGITEKPNYDYIFNSINALMKNYGYTNDSMFDWCMNEKFLKDIYSQNYNIRAGGSRHSSKNNQAIVEIEEENKEQLKANSPKSSLEKGTNKMSPNLRSLFVSKREGVRDLTKSYDFTQKKKNSPPPLKLIKEVPKTKK